MMTYPKDRVEFRKGVWYVWINDDDHDEFNTRQEAEEEAMRRFGVQQDGQE